MELVSAHVHEEPPKIPTVGDSESFQAGEGVLARVSPVSFTCDPFSKSSNLSGKRSRGPLTCSHVGT